MQKVPPRCKAPETSDTAETPKKNAKKAKARKEKSPILLLVNASFGPVYDCAIYKFPLEWPVVYRIYDEQRVMIFGGVSEKCISVLITIIICSIQAWL